MDRSRSSRGNCPGGPQHRSALMAAAIAQFSQVPNIVCGASQAAVAAEPSMPIRQLVCGVVPAWGADWGRCARRGSFGPLADLFAAG